MSKDLFNGINDNRVMVKSLTIAAVLVILTSAFFGWLMTSYGLILTCILPKDALISQRALSYLLGSVLHAALVVLYISISMSLGRGRTSSSLRILLPFFAALLLITVYFSFLSITYEAKGSTTFNGLLSDIKGLDQKITQSDYHIRTTFSTQVDALERLARDSDRGFDETGIAACGPICKRYLNDRSELLSRFSLLTQELPNRDLDADNDVNNAWRFVGARYESFLRKIKPFDEFLKEVNVSTASWNEVKDQYAKVQQRFGQKDSVDKISLVTNRVNSYLKGFLNGEKMAEDEGFFLFLILACLPETINFAIMLALTVFLRPVEISAQDLEDEKSRCKLEREYVATRNMHSLFKKAHGKASRILQKTIVEPTH